MGVLTQNQGAQGTVGASVGLRVDGGPGGERSVHAGDKGQREKTYYKCPPAGHCWNDRALHGPHEDRPECERENGSAPGAPRTLDSWTTAFSGLRVTARGSMPPAHGQHLHTEHLAQVCSNFQENVNAIVINIHFFKIVLKLQQLFLQY